MDYALIMLHHSFDSIKKNWPWMPHVFHQYIMGIMPPRTFPVPGGFVLGSGEGALTLAPASLSMLERSPERVVRAVERAAAHVTQAGARSVGVDPAIPPAAIASPWHRGSAVSAAGMFACLETAIRRNRPKRGAGSEIAVLGTGFTEVSALAYCLSGLIDGVNLAGGRPDAMERLATDFWKTTGVSPRIHRNVGTAIGRSKFILVGGTLAEGTRPTLAGGQVLIEMRYPYPVTASFGVSSPVLSVHAPVFQTPMAIEAFEPDPPSTAALIEAALVSIKACDGISLTRPLARDLTRLRTELERHGVTANGVWHGSSTTTLPSLTLMVA